MNYAVAVDASVAVKWVVAEEFTDRAQALLRDGLRVAWPLLAPPHFAGEVVNAIHRRTQRAEQPLSPEQASQAVADFLTFPVKLLTPADLYWQALTRVQSQPFATVYDSLYVVFAQILEVELWTADERLLRALGETAPWVRFIGEYSL